MRRALIAAALLLLTATAWAEENLPARYTFDCRQGVTFVRVITWCTGVTRTQCLAGTGLVDLTGYTAKVELRNPGTGAVVDTFTESTGLALGGALGTITWTMTATETALFAVGALNYDLRLTSGGGTVTYLLAGNVNVQARVTQ